MKRISLIIAACCLALGACAQNPQQLNSSTNQQLNNMKKTLIVYFSATGNTKAAAQKLAKEFNADLKKTYPQYKWGESKLMN